MEVFVLLLTIAGVEQIHPRGYIKHTAAERKARKLVQTGAASSARILTVMLSPSITANHSASEES